MSLSLFIFSSIRNFFSSCWSPLPGIVIADFLQTPMMMAPTIFSLIFSELFILPQNAASGMFAAVSWATATTVGRQYRLDASPVYDFFLSYSSSLTHVAKAVLVSWRTRFSRETLLTMCCRRSVCGCWLWLLTLQECVGRRMLVNKKVYVRYDEWNIKVGTVTVVEQWARRDVVLANHRAVGDLY